MTTIEKAAKAIYEARNGAGCKPWAHLPKSHREPYLVDARKRVEIVSGQWLRAGKHALAGDLRDIRLRVDLAEAPPMMVVPSDAALGEKEAV